MKHKMKFISVFVITILMFSLIPISTSAIVSEFEMEFLDQGPKYQGITYDVTLTSDPGTSGSPETYNNIKIQVRSPGGQWSTIADFGASNSPEIYEAQVTCDNIGELQVRARAYWTYSSSEVYSQKNIDCLPLLTVNQDLDTFHPTFDLEVNNLLESQNAYLNDRYIEYRKVGESTWSKKKSWGTEGNFYGTFTISIHRDEFDDFTSVNDMWELRMKTYAGSPVTHQLYSELIQFTVVPDVGNILGYYTFDGDLKDKGLNNLPLQGVNNPSLVKSIVTKGLVSEDGSDRYSSVNVDQGSYDNMNEWTIGFDFNYRADLDTALSTSGSQKILAMEGATSSSRRTFGFTLGRSYLVGNFWDETSEGWISTRYYYDTNSDLHNDKNWHHIAATWDGSSIRLYVDGDLKDTVTISNGMPGQNPIYFNIGDPRVSAWYDNVIVLDSAATAEDISKLAKLPKYEITGARIKNKQNFYDTTHTHGDTYPVVFKDNAKVLEFDFVTTWTSSTSYCFEAEIDVYDKIDDVTRTLYNYQSTIKHHFTVTHEGRHDTHTVDLPSILSDSFSSSPVYHGFSYGPHDFTALRLLDCTSKEVVNERDPEQEFIVDEYTENDDTSVVYNMIVFWIGDLATIQSKVDKAVLDFQTEMTDAIGWTVIFNIHYQEFNWCDEIVIQIGNNNCKMSDSLNPMAKMEQEFQTVTGLDKDFTNRLYRHNGNDQPGTESENGFKSPFYVKPSRSNAGFDLLFGVTTYDIDVEGAIMSGLNANGGVLWAGNPWYDTDINLFHVIKHELSHSFGMLDFDKDDQDHIMAYVSGGGQGIGLEAGVSTWDFSYYRPTDPSYIDGYFVIESLLKVFEMTYIER